MEDIQIWSIDGTQVAQLSPSNQMESEHLLEETLVDNPDLLMEGLTLVGRQTPTQGGPLDLLGVDEDGKLVVFELKRGTLSRDAVAQVIDYASYLNAIDLTDLANHISESSGAHGIDEIEDFEQWYRQDFGELESLKPLRMFLVGLGVDGTAERMVKYLATGDIDISLLTFHGFLYNGKLLLAKQVEVAGDKVAGPRPPRPSRSERERQLDDRAGSAGIHEPYTSVRAMFRDNWLGSGERPIALGMNITLPPQSESGRRRRRYARVDPLVCNIGTVRIVFYPRAANLCRDEFIPLIEELGGDTYPRGLDPLRDTDTEILLPLTGDDWEIHEDKLTALVQTVYESWQNSGSGE